MRSATASSAGARRRSTTSGSCPPTWASATRSTSSTWPGWCSPTTTGTPTPTPSWAPTPQPTTPRPFTIVVWESVPTRVNGLGVVGWGVGGIEAEAAMLGQPISMLIPEVVGVRLTGKLAEGATATDLVLTITQMLRTKGVVGKFVEFFGEGLSTLPL